MPQYRFQIDPDAINLTKLISHEFSTGRDNEIVVMHNLDIVLDQNAYSAYYDDTTGFIQPSIDMTLVHTGGEEKISVGWDNPVVLGSNSTPAVGQYIFWRFEDLEGHDLKDYKVKANDWSMVVTRTGGMQNQTQYFTLEYSLEVLSNEEWLKIHFDYDQPYEVFV